MTAVAESANTNKMPSHSGPRGQLPRTLTLLLVAPLGMLLGWAFFYPILTLLVTSVTEPHFTLDNYTRLFSEPLYLTVVARTIWISILCAIFALCIGYPVAAVMARPNSSLAKIATICVMLPLWTSVLVRSYAWIILLEYNGIINSTLQSWGLIKDPLKLLYTDGAVLMAMTHVLVPFMILPIYSALMNIPADLPRAAANLGAGKLSIFWLVIFPLSLPGVFAGCLIVFVMALGFYITPALVGGPQTLMIATLIGQQAMQLLNWPFAGALSLVLLAISLGITIVFKKLLRLEKVVAHE